MNTSLPPSQKSPTSRPPSILVGGDGNTDSDQPFNPGQATGIISLLLAFVGLAPFGLVLSIISTVQSRKAKVSTLLGVMGICINMVAVLTMAFLITIFVTTHTNLR